MVRGALILVCTEGQTICILFILGRMKLVSETVYHIYNQGNNRQKIFYDDKDYITFLKLYRELISDNCETLCYCLMPNHFHFLVYATDKSVETKKLGAIQIQNLSNGYRLLLSKYAQIINEKRQSSGSLFRQKTKAKEITFEVSNQQISYAELCFSYIHNNPIAAGLAKNLSDWEYSSYKDYAGLRKGTLCNQKLTSSLFGYNMTEKQKTDSSFKFDSEIEKIFFSQK